MTKASFYILSSNSLDSDVLSRWNIAYRLCKKSMLNGKTTLICSVERLQELSDFLWSHTESDFLAHDTNNANAYINITNSYEDIDDSVVINLGTEAVLNSRASRIIEIIGLDEQNKKEGRLRYKSYKTQGYTLENFNI